MPILETLASSIGQMRQEASGAAAARFVDDPDLIPVDTVAGYGAMPWPRRAAR